MHSQNPRTKTALAPSTVRTGDGAKVSCWPPRKRSKRRRPSTPDNRLSAATLIASMPLESFRNWEFRCAVPNLVVRGGFVGAVDDQLLDGRFARLQLQTERFHGVAEGRRGSGI